MKTETHCWIELHNPDGGSVNLNGYYLTDDFDQLTKWQFPAVTIPGNGFLVIFASSKDRRPVDGNNLHTNFNLNGGGEYLALVASDGVTILSEYGSRDASYTPKDRHQLWILRRPSTDWLRCPHPRATPITQASSALSETPSSMWIEVSTRHPLN